MTVKEQTKTILDKVPEQITLEDVQYHLYVLQCIEQGRKAAAEGRVYMQGEAEKRLSKWLER